MATEQKAKADNRYFSTMRSKEALGAENAVLTKLAEKQQRAVESAGDLQHSLGIQLVRLVVLSLTPGAVSERGFPIERQADTFCAAGRPPPRRRSPCIRIVSARIRIPSRPSSGRTRSCHCATSSTRGRLPRCAPCPHLALRCETLTPAIYATQINALLGQRIAQAETELAARKKVEEQLSKQEKELKQAKAAKLAVMPSFSSSGSGGGTAEVRELKKYNEDLSVSRYFGTSV